MSAGGRRTLCPVLVPGKEEWIQVMVLENNWNRERRTILRNGGGGPGRADP